MNHKIPLIALHGGPGGTTLSTEPLLKLGTDRRVFIYDQLGGGKSSPTPKSKWKFETFVKELGILINAWKLERFHLFGVSCGSTLALEYYRETRDPRIQSIIFQSPFFSAKDWQKDANRLVSKLPKKYQKIIRYCHEIDATDSKVYEEALEQYYLRHVIRNKRQFRSGRKNHNPGGKKIYGYMWGPSEFCAAGTLRTYEKAKELQKIQVPTLFIAGQYDEAQPKTVRKYQRLMKHSEFCVIPDASHAIARERPAKLRSVIRKFLEKVETTDVLKFDTK